MDHVNLLMNAARTANEEVIMTLFLKKLDLTCVDEDGNTALHIAAMVRRYVRFSAKANTTIRFEKRTAYIYKLLAAKANESSHF
ncbi:unnamed protein product [Strongylus vulgaris]|uniref:Uncharacterized protein n=1 Tax=Strongylus vulgaris TaxID=40348 RepID=A0A3P7INZ3_STRVU|nr:unnamed protein product [Strongylus vulgaris]